MTRQKKTHAGAGIIILLVLLLCMPTAAKAGNLEPPGPPPTRFTDNLNGTVTDTKTGLIWLQNANCFGYIDDIYAATYACNALASPSCGLSDGSVAGDWRLPTYEELYSIGINPSGTWTKPGAPFINVQSDNGYWGLETSYGRGPIFAWCLNMDDPGVPDYPSSCYVWPVRDGPSAPPGLTMKTLDEIPPTRSQKLPAAQRFVLVLDDAAVLDKETGLVWEKSPDSTGRTWSDAFNYCYPKTVGGRKGWRLPTVDELASLVDPTQSDPALPSGHPFLIGGIRGHFSSSTEDVGDPDVYWVVHLSINGFVYRHFKNYGGYVWCVRGGQ